MLSRGKTRVKWPKPKPVCYECEGGDDPRTICPECLPLVEAYLVERYRASRRAKGASNA